MHHHRDTTTLPIPLPTSSPPLHLLYADPMMAGLSTCLYRIGCHMLVLSSYMESRVLRKSREALRDESNDIERQAAITKLLAADRRRQAQFIEALKLQKELQDPEKKQFQEAAGTR
ncbi:hypothetical protein Tco_0375695 [Tanacetum coccineum]